MKLRPDSDLYCPVNITEKPINVCRDNHLFDFHLSKTRQDNCIVDSKTMFYCSGAVSHKK